MSGAGAVDAQVAAYNAHDVEAFAACYTEEVVIKDAERNVLIAGRDALRAHYASLFARFPDLRAEIVTRIRIGAHVIGEEQVTGTGTAPIHAVAIYRVADDLISHVQLLRA